MNILVVEDDSATRILLKTHLKRAGYNVELATSGDDALLKISTEFHPDLVITDILMPYVDGYQFLKEFRENFEEFKNTPIIVISAVNIKDDVIKALKLGANDYITKPYKMDELIQKVKKLLGE